MNADINRTMSRLDGRSAIVTGGTRGIGLAIAKRFVDEGARVLITGRKQEGLDAALAQFPDGTAVGLTGKADDPEHRGDVFRKAAEVFGGLDILVANAGINPVHGPLAELDLAAARKVLDVNVIATLAWIQDAVRDSALHFRERRGNVIIVSSVTGQVPSENIGWYGVSKAANAHLTRTLGVELGPHIRVNAVAPAVVRTRFSEALYEGKEEAVAADYPLKRLGAPEDIAAAAAYLASDDASWVTSQVLTLDGGLLMAGGTA